MNPWADPRTFWLNVTNAALGLVVVVAVVALMVSVAGDVLSRVRNGPPAGPHLYQGPRLGAAPGEGKLLARHGRRHAKKR